MKRQDDKEQWVMAYLRKNDIADVCNADFVSSYIKKFNAKFTYRLWGSDKCPELGRLLSKMYSMGMLNRARISISGDIVHEGFPKWVYTYRLRGAFK